MLFVKPSDEGFTLLEVLVVIAIASILLIVAVPSFTTTITRNRIASEVNDLFSALQFARSEALKQGAPVSVCASRDQVTCNTTNVNAWQGGFIVFTDPNGNAVVDTGDVILRKWPAYAGSETAVASNSLGAFTFNRQGFAAGLPANPVSVAVSAVTGADTTNNRCIVISLAGRIQTKVPTAGVCT